jgi:hypothetical protein
MHGYGILTRPDGERYEGEWKGDNKHGRGVYVHVSGECYEGEWRDDVMHGRGTFAFANGERYKDEWAHDLRHGRGILTFPNGDRYEATWHEGHQLAAVSIYTWATGQDLIPLTSGGLCSRSSEKEYLLRCCCFCVYDVMPG